MALLAVLVLASGAQAKEAEKVRRDDLQIVHDGKGHYLAYRMRHRAAGPEGALRLSPGVIYVGEGTRFWLLERDTHAQEPPPGVHFTFIDFRFPAPGSASRYAIHDVDGDGSTVTVECGAEKQRFVAVSGKERAKILQSATFQDHPMGRVPHALLRDDDGNYYYIDRSANPARPYDRQVYRGRRGNLAPLTLKDVLIDMAGELYVGKTGKLRIEREDGNATRAVWIDKKGTERPLTMVAMDIQLAHAGFAAVNAFIYNDLGMYLGKKLGTPCDWL